jgi:4-hydroxy-tetrahydrodipicolinate synthase
MFNTTGKNTMRGAWTALITPMKDDFTVDFDGWRLLVEGQLEAGIDGLVPLGTTGENPTLDEDEEERVIKIIIDARDAFEKRTGRHVPVMIGTGSNDTRHMLSYTRRARDAGADAALVVTPYYNKPNESGLLRHFEEAAKTGIPVVVYNIKGRTGLNSPTPRLAKIAEISGVIGVKEASGDIGQAMDVIRTIKIPREQAGKPFAVMSGDDALTLPMMAAGGDGVISVLSNLVPEKVKALTDACLSGDYARARTLNYALSPLAKAAFIETNPVPIKRALTLAGLPGGPCRLPLGPLSETSEHTLREAMKGLGLR